jgi:predicted nucleic acid-binding protein
MVLVDSSIWIESFRREGDLLSKIALEALLDEYEAFWCGPIKLEVLGGARKKERKKLEFFFDCIPCRSITDSIWDEAKLLSWKLRDRGFSLPWNDVLIGSIALQWDVRVFARDQHFDVMSREMNLRLYKPGHGGIFQPD